MKAEILTLTKHVIFKYISEEQIFERYLGEPVDLEAKYTNPFRTDKRPGCSFYYRDGSHKLIFHDFAWGVQWDCFDLVQYAYNINYPQALEKIAYDFGLRDRSLRATYTLREVVKLEPTQKISNAIQIKRKPFNKGELAFWNVGGLEITVEDLEDNRIFSITSFWETTQKGTNYYNKLDMTFAYQFGPETFQIYSPLKERSRRKFINPTNLKVGDLKRLDSTANYVVITKSRKDSFLLRMLGINCCFIIAEGVYLTPEVLKVLDKYPIKFTLFDNDKAGVKASRKYRDEYNTTPLLYPRYFNEEGKLMTKDTYDNLVFFGKDYILQAAHYLKMVHNL